MVALNSHGLVLSALYEDLDLENATLCFLLRELPRGELSWLRHLCSPAASLKTPRGAKCLLLAGVLLSSSPQRGRLFQARRK